MVMGCLGMFATSVFAGTTYVNFNVDVPKINRSAFTGEQTKTTQSKAGHIRFTLVGGGYKVNCRMNKKADGSEGAWANNMATGSTANLPSRASHNAGDKVRVRIKNKLTTLVDVNAHGTWRSN